MAFEPELSDKMKYPTFARTEPIGRQLTPAIRELLRYFKWKKFALIVENSTMYTRASVDIRNEFKESITEFKYMHTSPHYAYENHYDLIVRDMKEISKKARSK